MKTINLLAILLLAGCTLGEQRLSGEDELARELAGRVAGEPRSCVPMAGQSPLIPIDRNTIIYRDGRRIWVNRLRSECANLTPHSTLLTETFGSQYCRGDRVRRLDPGSSIPGPHCLLGEFVPYTLSNSRD